MRKHTPLLINFGFLHTVGSLLLVLLFCSSATAAVTLHPSLSVETSYTDNVDLVAENDAEEHEVITTISPTFDLSLTGRMSEAVLSYTPSYSIYSRFSDNNELRHSASLTAMRRITRTTRVELTNDYLYTEDPAYDTIVPLSELDTTVRRDREPYQTNSTDLSLIHQFGPEDEIALGYRYYFLRNDDPTYEDSDYYEPSLMVTYWPVRNRFGTEVEVGYTNRDFDDSEDYDDTFARLRLIQRLSPHLDIYVDYTHEWTNYADEGTDYQVYSPLAGFIWEASANLSISAGLGYFFQENDDDDDDVDIDDEDGLTGSLEAVYNWRDRNTLSLSGAYGYDQTDTAAETLGFTEYYSVTGVLDYQLARRLFSHFLAGYQRNSYTEVEPERDDDVWRVSASLSYQLLAWMELEVGYAFRDISSDLETEEYTENRAFFSVTMSPRQPYFLSR